MEKGADVNSPLSLPARPISPLHITLDLFLQPKKDIEKDVLREILQELIDHGAKIKPNGGATETSLEKFVKASTELDSTSLSVRQEQIRPSSLVGYFLSAERNPLCGFPKQYCPAHQCTSLAAFIFAHTPKSGLSTSLIESSDMKMYGLELVEVLLKPCKMRYSMYISTDDLTVNDLLRNLLERIKAQNVPGELQPGLLRHILERTSKQKGLERLELVLTSGYISKMECRKALTRLDDESDDIFRLSLSEFLLAQLGLRDTTWFLFNQSISQIQDLTDDDHARESFKDNILTALDMPLHIESADAIVQCVVRVYTKSMLDGSWGRTDVSADQIIFIASRLRQQYGLPDIPVAKQLLLGLHYSVPRPKKLL